jgi:uncharacterized protein with HEPN domain
MSTRTLTVRGVPVATLKRLRARAVANRRSLNSELLEILDAAVAGAPRPSSAELAPGSDHPTLAQMLATAQRIGALARERSREAFESDYVAQLAMLHLIQRLGEAASRLSADFRAEHEEFPWAEMIGMRNRIVHGYEDEDPDIVWRVATADIEPVIAGLERALAG